MTKGFAVLLKFGQRDHLKEFRAGNLYMNTQKYFSELEKDSVRSDRYEGIDFIHQPKDIRSIKITDNNTGKEFIFGPHQLAGPFIGSNRVLGFNLFCMYAITKIEPNVPFVDPRNFQFGNSFIIVTHTQKFLDRVNIASNLAGWAAAWDMVKYYDPTEYSGDVGPFDKSSSFEFEQEFRVVVSAGSAEPIRLKVGNLADITTPIFPLAEINRSVSITSNNENRRRRAG